MSDSDNTLTEQTLSRYQMRAVDPAARARTLCAAREAWESASEETIPLWRAFLRTAAAVAAVWVVATITVVVDGKRTESVLRHGTVSTRQAPPRSESEQWLARLGIDHPLYPHMLRAQRRTGASVMLPHFPDKLDKLINNGG